MQILLELLLSVLVFIEMIIINCNTNNIILGFLTVPS